MWRAKATRSPTCGELPGPAITLRAPHDGQKCAGSVSRR